MNGDYTGISYGNTDRNIDGNMDEDVNWNLIGNGYGIKYRSADEMRESGIEWLGLVPINWKTERLNYVMTMNPTRAHIINLKLECSFVPMNKLHNGSIDLDEIKHVGEVINGYTCFENHDVIMAKVTPCFENGNIAVAEGLTNGIGFGSTEINVFRAIRADLRFLYYRLQESHIMKYGVSHMYGVAGLKRVPSTYFENFHFSAPAIHEQHNIANFLDITTAQFDAIIAMKVLLITKLEEAKKALISEVVTGKVKIVDGTLVARQPDEMKDSGIEWLGMIPKEWGITKLKYVGKTIIGLTYSPEDVVEEGTLVLRSSNIQKGQLNYSDSIFVSKKIPEELVTRKGDILVCSRNGSRNLIGKNVIIDKKAEGVTFGAFMAVYRTAVWEFMYFVFNSTLFDFQSSSFLTSTINQLTSSNMSNFIVALPKDKKEQVTISQLLNSEQRADRKKRMRLETQIQLLKSAKQSLISEAVTGKIDLRGWQIIEQEGAS